MRHDGVVGRRKPVSLMTLLGNHIILIRPPPAFMWVKRNFYFFKLLLLVSNYYIMLNDTEAWGLKHGSTQEVSQKNRALFSWPLQAWIDQFTPQPATHEVSSRSTFLPTHSVINLLKFYPFWWGCINFSLWFLICISLIANVVEQLFVCILAVGISSLVKCLFKCFVHRGLSVFFLFLGSFYIVWIWVHCQIYCITNVFRFCL